MTQPATFSSIGRIIQRAYRHAKLIEPGVEPNGEQFTDGMNALNDLVNELQMGGLMLWMQQDLPIPLTAGTFQYPLTTAPFGKPLRIPRDLSYMLYVASGTTNSPKVPVISLSQQEWTLLSNTGSTQGLVSQIYVDKQLAQLMINTYLVPDTTTATNYVLHVVVQQQIPQGMQLTDTMQFPPEQFMSLTWLLSQQLCQGQPMEVVQRIDAMAAKYRAEAEGWDVEDTQVFFTPDNRQVARTNRFA
jgi:hypothetical protein